MVSVGIGRLGTGLVPVGVGRLGGWYAILLVFWKMINLIDYLVIILYLINCIFLNRGCCCWTTCFLLLCLILGWLKIGRSWSFRCWILRSTLLPILVVISLCDLLLMIGGNQLIECTSNAICVTVIAGAVVGSVVGSDAAVE